MDRYYMSYNKSEGKRPWCWERLRAGGEGDDRGWNGWMASLTRRTWVWANSGRWWRRGKPDMMQSTGSQRVKSNWATEQTHVNLLESTGDYPVLSTDLNGKEIQGGGDACICMADSLCHAAETNTMLVKHLNPNNVHTYKNFREAPCRGHGL